MVQIDDSAYQRRAEVVAPYGMVCDVGMCEWTAVRWVSEEVAYIDGAAVLLVVRRVDVRADNIRPYKMMRIDEWYAPTP